MLLLEQCTVVVFTPEPTTGVQWTSARWGDELRTHMFVVKAKACLLSIEAWFMVGMCSEPHPLASHRSCLMFVRSSLLLLLLVLLLLLSLFVAAATATAAAVAAAAAAAVAASVVADTAPYQ